MKLLLVLAMISVLATVNEAYCSADPVADDGMLLKPLSGLASDCTLNPLSYKPGKYCDDPIASPKRRECNPVPEKCVITTYFIPEPGGPEHSLSNIKTIIDYDPTTGEGKVYAVGMFGKPLEGQVPAW